MSELLVTAFGEFASKWETAWTQCQQCVPFNAAKDVASYAIFDQEPLGEGFADCWKCLHDFTTETNSLPLTYVIDMLTLGLTGTTKAVCGRNFKKVALNPDEGVDIEQYPTGWMPKGDGTFTGCEVIHDFPGMNVRNVASHAIAKKEMKELITNFDNGKWWRGNELGYFISDETPFGNVSPKSILLGSNPSQHAVIRPIMDRIWGKCDEECFAKLVESAKAYQNVDELDMKSAASEYVHNYLFESTFPGQENPIAFDEFGKYQTKFTILNQFSQILPPAVSQVLLKRIQDDFQVLFDAYRVLTVEQYGEKLLLADQTDECAPTASCIDQMTQAIIDAFLSAGGLSVPAAILNSAWVMHVDDKGEMGNKVFPKHFILDVYKQDDKLTEVFYEVMRVMPPVVGFPWWTVAPERAGDESKSQVKGGKRTLVSISLAGKDPNAWGEDAFNFRVRDHDEYKEKFIGFADFAKDYNVRSGAQNRYCPGKVLSLEMGRAWLSVWEQQKWYNCGGKSHFKEVTPYNGGLTLCTKRGLKLKEEREANSRLFSDFKLVDVEKDKIANEMEYVQKGDNFPQDFAGIWWMDGNPLPDYAVSFSKSSWQSVEDGWKCEDRVFQIPQVQRDLACSGGFLFPVYEAKVWLWDTNPLGRILYRLAETSKLNYKWDCYRKDAGDDAGQIQYCRVTPTTNIFGPTIDVPANLLYFDIIRVDKDSWVRRSYYGSTRGLTQNLNIRRDYYFKQVVNGEGQPGTYWEQWMSNGKARNTPFKTDVFGNPVDESNKSGLFKNTVTNVPSVMAMAVRK